VYLQDSLLSVEQALTWTTTEVERGHFILHVDILIFDWQWSHGEPLSSCIFYRFVMAVSLRYGWTTRLNKRRCSLEGNSVLMNKYKDRRPWDNHLIGKSLFKSDRAVDQLEKLVGSWVNRSLATVGVSFCHHAAIPSPLLSPRLYKQTFPPSALRHSQITDSLFLFFLLYVSLYRSRSN